MEKSYQGIWNPTVLARSAAGSLKEKLQICTRGNQVENDFEHVKCICVFSISVTQFYTK
jgi:hypothetical protein